MRWNTIEMQSSKVKNFFPIVTTFPIQFAAVLQSLPTETPSLHNLFEPWEWSRLMFNSTAEKRPQQQSEQMGSVGAQRPICLRGPTTSCLRRLIGPTRFPEHYLLTNSRREFRKQEKYFDWHFFAASRNSRLGFVLKSSSGFVFLSFRFCKAFGWAIRPERGKKGDPEMEEWINVHKLASSLTKTLRILRYCEWNFNHSAWLTWISLSIKSAPSRLSRDVGGRRGECDEEINLFTFVEWVGNYGSLQVDIWSQLWFNQIFMMRRGSSERIHNSWIV